MTDIKDKTPLKFGLLLYPQFEVLDVFGPLEALNTLSRAPNFVGEKITLEIVAKTLDPVSPGPILPDTSGEAFAAPQALQPTCTLKEAPQFDFLLVPGGKGTFEPDGSFRDDLGPEIEFIAKQYPGLQYLMTVCTGSAIAAKSGVLNGRCATTNKAAWDLITTMTPESNNIQWVAHARWVVSGNVWTTSGVSAGTDGMMAWITDTYGSPVADAVATSMEYNRVFDARDDPFAKIYNCEDVPKTSLTII